MRGRAIAIVLMLISAQALLGQMKEITGTVTYVAAGTVYTSLGRESGLKDSTIVYVKSKGDTVGVLQVIALSSKSSACKIVRSSREISVGNVIVARVYVESPKLVAEIGAMGAVAASKPPRVSGTSTRIVAPPGPFEIGGRVSAQYFAQRYDNALYNTTQPGVVVNLHARSTDIPLKFTLYSNLRTLSYGRTSPFSRGSHNQSRLYNLSLEYDDGVNDIALGRIIPAVAPTVGYIDGAMYARTLGRFTLGTTLGYQPSYALRGVSTEYKKIALFASVQPVDSTNLTISSAYARTYYHSYLDREVVSANVMWYSPEGLQVYGYSEFDLRQMSNGEFILSPQLTSLFMNVSYRATEMLTLGIGTDASRPLYTFSAARFTPDSLRETGLRSGISTTVSLYLPGGVMVSNTFYPRSSESRFASVYSNYTTLGISNLLTSGVSVRSSFNLNANEYSSSKGFTVSVQRNIVELADVNIRYQQNIYTLKNYADRHLSRTVGADVMLMLTRQLGFMMSYDMLKGYGISSNSLFGELSMRF